MTDFDEYVDRLIDTDPIHLGRIARGLEADGRAVREELYEMRSAARVMRHHYELFRERVHDALTEEEGMTPGLRLDDIRKAEDELAEGLASMTEESSDAE